MRTLWRAGAAGCGKTALVSQFASKGVDTASQYKMVSVLLQIEAWAEVHLADRAERRASPIVNAMSSPDPPCLQTVGTELAVAEVPLEDSNVLVKLHVLDCGGHTFQSNLVEDILGASSSLCCLVYSVSDLSSFKAVRQWYGILSAAARKGFPQAQLRGVLVATKTDVSSSRHHVCATCY